MKRMTSNLGFAADANQGVRALEVSLLLLLIAYLHSVLARLFPKLPARLAASQLPLRRPCLRERPRPDDARSWHFMEAKT